MNPIPTNASEAIAIVPAPAAPPILRPLRTSAAIANLAAALARAQASFGALKKDRTAEIATRSGTHYRYSYATLSAVIEAIRQPLATNELALVQALQLHEGIISVETSLLHSSGEWIASELALIVGDSLDPRAIASVITYGRRYSVCSLLTVAADDDDDAAATVPAKRTATQATASSAADPSPARKRRSRDESQPITDAQRRKLFAEARAHGWETDALKTMLLARFGVESSKDLRGGDLDQVLQLLRNGPASEPPL
jgi:hypothetical protein